VWVQFATFLKASKVYKVDLEITYIISVGGGGAEGGPVGDKQALTLAGGPRGRAWKKRHVLLREKCGSFQNISFWS
jgi:hypothetical protein